MFTNLHKGKAAWSRQRADKAAKREALRWVRQEQEHLVETSALYHKWMNSYQP